MCGIIYANSLTGQPVNKKIIKQFNKQMSRGVQGFGIYDGDYQNIVRTPHKRKIVRWLKRYPSSDILFHHRLPTSTDNVKNACHPFSTGSTFDTQYILVHNGVLWNDDELYVDHCKMGIQYSSKQRDGRYNDSEALLWDFALYMEGKQTEMKAEGSIAFICMAIKGDSKTLYFGRNSGSPLNLLMTDDVLMLSSEGAGKSIETNTLYQFDYDTNTLTSSPMTIPSGYRSYQSTAYYGGYMGSYDFNDYEDRTEYNGGYTYNTTEAKNIADAYLEMSDGDVKLAMDMIETDISSSYYGDNYEYIDQLDDAYSVLVDRSIMPEYSIVQQHLQLMEERDDRRNNN